MISWFACISIRIMWVSTIFSLQLNDCPSKIHVRNGKWDSIEFTKWGKRTYASALLFLFFFFPFLTHTQTDRFGNGSAHPNGKIRNTKSSLLHTLRTLTMFENSKINCYSTASDIGKTVDAFIVTPSHAIQ